MTDGMERAVEAGLRVFQHLRYASSVTDETIIRRALSAALPLVAVAREKWSEAERHAVGHAKYQVERATADNPDVSFDYELVAALLRLIDRLALSKHTGQPQEGWQLVPVEPTEEMLAAAWAATSKRTPEEYMAMALLPANEQHAVKMHNRYRAMLSASPPRHSLPNRD